MYCPSCGQQQMSTETRFCSKCGLPMGLITEVVSNGGWLPQLSEMNKKRTFFNKKNGVAFGLFFFIVFSMFLTAFFAILGAPEELVAVCAIVGVFGGLLTSIASLIFLPSSKAGQMPIPMTQVAPIAIDTGSPQAALPPTQATPAGLYGPPAAGSWRDTNDLVPSSVTDSTTRLLTQERDK